VDGDLRTGFLLPRLPPYNLEMEQAVLGGLLCNNKAYERVGDFLLPFHFMDHAHQHIYRAIQERISRGSVADPVTLKSYFENACKLDEIGGVSALTGLVSCVVGITVVPDYAKALVDLWRRRETINIGQRMVEDAFNSDQDILALTGSVTDALDQITLGDDNQKPTLLADAMEQAIEGGVAARKAREAAERGEPVPPHVCTGLPLADSIIGHMEPGDVIVLGARPKTGKSAIALQIALHNAKNGVPVEYCSTEMKAVQLGRRALAMESGVSVKVQKHGDWSKGDNNKLTDAWAQLNKVRSFFSIEDVPGMNMSIIGSRAKAFARKHPGKIGLLIIDHMHDLGEMHVDQMTAAIGKIAIAAKTIAKTLGWPVLVLAQMNRKIDDREEKQPEVSDLYGGMQLEAIASAVVLLHRPDRYLSPVQPERKSGEGDEPYARRLATWEGERNRLRGKLEMFIRMVRDGEPGHVALRFDGPSNRSTEEDTV
jgi:replicative DNA helicase